MSTLKGQFIADTYPFVLHTYNQSISAGGVVPVINGSGAATSISVGLSGNGITVTGPLTASGLRYPINDGPQYSIMFRDGTKTLALTGFDAFLRLLGGVTSGNYSNPTLQLTNGVITSITSNATGGLSAFPLDGSYSMVVPPNVRKMKFSVTGGGGGAYIYNGGAGGNVSGWVTTNPGDTIQVVVGSAGTSSAGAYIGGQSSFSVNGNTVAYANGGNSRNSSSTSYPSHPNGGGTAAITDTGGSNVISYYVVKGGDGGNSVSGENDRESVGAASVWGSGGAYGGGQGTSTGGAIGAAGTGFVLFEW